MEPSRFYWEELEPPQFRLVPVMVPNYGPPDPDWLWDEDGDCVFGDEYEGNRWSEKVEALDDTGNVIQVEQRVSGWVKVLPGDARYNSAPYEESFIRGSGMWAT